VGYDFYALPPSRGHALQLWASRFGFGDKTGIDVGPRRPACPDARVAAAAFRPAVPRSRPAWKPGYSVQLAIGQGDLPVTPLQMARFYSMIANGGKLVTPHVVDDVEQPTNDPRAPRSPAPASRPAADAERRRPGGAARRAGGPLGDARAVGTSSGVFGTSRCRSPARPGRREARDAPGYSTPAQVQPVVVVRLRAGRHPTIVVCAVIENGGHGGTPRRPAALKVFEAVLPQHGPHRPTAVD
jgi:penicillin-binding protein 2